MGKFSCCFILFVSFSVVRAVGDSKDDSGAASGASAQRETAEEPSSRMSEGTSSHESTQGKAPKLTTIIENTATEQENGWEAVSGGSAGENFSDENSSDVSRSNSMRRASFALQSLASHVKKLVTFFDDSKKGEAASEHIIGVCTIYVNYVKEGPQESATKKLSFEDWKISELLSHLPSDIEKVCNLVHENAVSYLTMDKSRVAPGLRRWLEEVNNVWEDFQESFVPQEQARKEALLGQYHKQALAAISLADHLLALVGLITTETQATPYNRMNALCRAYDSYSIRDSKKIANVSAFEAAQLGINIKLAANLRRLRLNLPKSIVRLCENYNGFFWRWETFWREHMVVLEDNQVAIERWAERVLALSNGKIL